MTRCNAQRDGREKKTGKQWQLKTCVARPVRPKGSLVRRGIIRLRLAQRQETYLVTDSSGFGAKMEEARRGKVSESCRVGLLQCGRSGAGCGGKGVRVSHHTFAKLL
jgi:hypothetical protein